MPVLPEYLTATAEAAVKQGVAPAALIIPTGFGVSLAAFGHGEGRKAIQILHDSSDPVAAQVLAGILQKVTMAALPDVTAHAGMNCFDQASGGLTPPQQSRPGILRMASRSHHRPAAKIAANSSGGTVSSWA